MYYMHDSFELALHLCGLEESDENYENPDNVDPILYAKYGIEDTDKFNALIKDLLDLITINKSPLTDTVYKGFSNGKEWLIKKEMTPPEKTSSKEISLKEKLEEKMLHGILVLDYDPETYNYLTSKYECADKGEGDWICRKDLEEILKES